MFIQLHQGQSHAEVIPGTERGGAKVIQLDGGGLRLVERTREESRSSECGIHPMGLVPGPLGVCVGRCLKVATRRQRFDGGVTPADAYDSRAGNQMEEAVYDRLQYARQEAHREPIDGPERSYQLERALIGSGDCQENRDKGPYQSDRSNNQPHQAEGFLGPPAGTVAPRVDTIDR